MSAVHPASDLEKLPESWKPAEEAKPDLHVVVPAPKFMKGEPVTFNLKPGSKEWHERRAQGIGSSDIGAVMGLNPYESPHDLWLVKRGLGQVEENIAMRHGKYVETFIAREYARVVKQTGNKFKMLRAGTYQHPEYPHFLANPDRLIWINGVPGILECKAVGSWAARNFGGDGSDQIPQHYMAQIMWQLIVTGARFVHLAALIDGREIKPYTFTFDPNLSGKAHVFPEADGREMMRLADLFWRVYVLGGKEPKMTGHDSDTEWLQKQHTYENGRLTNTDEESDIECRKLGRALKRFERAEYVAAERKNRIKKFMAERGASELEWTGSKEFGNFKWTMNKNGVASFRHPFRSEKA